MQGIMRWSWRSKSPVAMQLTQGFWSAQKHSFETCVYSSHYHRLKHPDCSNPSSSHISKFNWNCLLSSDVCQPVSSSNSSPPIVDFGSLTHRQLSALGSKPKYSHISFQEKALDTTNINYKLLDSGLRSVTTNQVRYVHNSTRRRERYRRTFSSNGKSTEENKAEERKEKELPAENDSKLSLAQRFKKTYKEHGKVFIVVHLATSAVWFGTFYTAARCGVDIVPLLESWNLSEKFISPFRSGGLGNVALAYLMYKLATPARYTVTLGGTNFAIRYMKKEGFIQPVAKEDTLREMYKEGKENVKSRGQRTKGNLRSMRQRIQKRIRTRKRHFSDRKDS